MLSAEPRRSRDGVWLACFVVLAIVLGEGRGPTEQVARVAEAAEPIKIGALTEGWGPTPAMVGLREGLQALGYREGEQFVIGVRFTKGDIKSLPVVARDLIRAGSDIVFASGTNAAKAAQTATSTIPVIFAELVSDPVQLGLVQSFARPGANITGVTDQTNELAAKRLEIFKEMVPGLKRVLYAYDPTDPPSVEANRMYREAARLLGIRLLERPMRTDAEARAGFAAIRKADADGIVSGLSMSFNIPGLVLQATSQKHMPTMFSGAFWVERGALASYGPDFHESGRQVARLVDKIIKGAKPATIPVEMNAKIELVINLKVARSLEISISPAVVQRATRVIE